MVDSFGKSTQVNRLACRYVIGIVVGFDAGIELRSVDSVVCDWYSDDRANVYFDCLSAYAVANVGLDDKDFDSL